MWWPHLWRFAFQVWVQVLAWNSATTFSIAKETIIAPLLILLVTLQFTIGKGWWKPAVLQQHGGDVLRSFVVTAGVLFLLVGVAFVVAIPVVVYQDHMELVASGQRLTESNRRLTKERDEWKDNVNKAPKVIFQQSQRALHYVDTDAQQQRNHRREMRDALGKFLSEGIRYQVLAAKESDPFPETEANAWLSQVLDFLRMNLGDGYAARLQNGAGLPLAVTAIGDNHRRSIWGGLNTINARLTEFIAEQRD